MHRRKRKNKKAVSEIITTILIILLVLAAIVIIWNAVKETITEKSGEVDVEVLTTDINIEKASVYIDESQGVEKLQLSISRGADNVEISSMKVVIYGTINNEESSKTYVLSEPTGHTLPRALETKTYVFNLNGLNNIQKVLIYPVSQKGKFGIGEIYTTTNQETSPPENQWGSDNLVEPEQECVPGEETCDGKDNDCNGVVDEGCYCTDIRAQNYCDSFDTTLNINDGSECTNNGCNFFTAYCEGADINKDGSVGGYEQNLVVNIYWGRTDCSESTNWCDYVDMNRDGSVGGYEQNLVVNIYWERTDCNLQQNINVNCYVDFTCSGNSRSNCQNSGRGCLWISESVQCENPLIQASWTANSGILANGEFDRSQDAGSPANNLNVVQLGNDYSLKTDGEQVGTHGYQRWVEKDLNNLVSWGGSFYVNLKDIVHQEGDLTDVLLVGGYDQSGIAGGTICIPFGACGFYTYLRNLAIYAYRTDGKSYIGIQGYQQTIVGGSYLPGSEFEILGEDYTNINKPYQDKWIKIDWFFTPDHKLFAKTSDTEWRKIFYLGQDTDPFTKVAFGWVSSVSGGSLYFKNVTLYPESCIPEWMAQQY